MATKANLDALIVREDFEVEEDTTQFLTKQTIEIRDLEQEAFFYSVLRKPDFQRETADWTPERIVSLIKSFLDGDLIPAVILWYAPNNHVFVIDGAHRISALIAWVLDDYGDKQTSQLFFEHKIPEEQITAAKATRGLVAKEIGTYDDHKFAVRHPEKSKLEVVGRARRLAALAIQLQWVRGDARKAEASFLKINQQAVAIDKTELRLIQARKRPNGLAARAIIRSGTGHKYWFEFEENKKHQIQKTAEEIYTILFTPTLRTPIKTLDLPIAGSVYSPQALQLIFELVNLTNVLLPEPVDDEFGENKDEFADKDGSKTLEFLKSTQRVVDRISGNHPSSLGLHPAVYFYAANGRYQPTAFLAIVGLLKEFEKQNYYRTFTTHRRNFEDFILRHKNFANQVVVASGSGTKGLKPLQALYQTILGHLEQGKDEKAILEALLLDKKFKYLKIGAQEEIEYGQDFSVGTKSTAFLREAMKNALRCQICQGFIHKNSISFDHKERKTDGGIGHPENAQLTHFYCNTTFKH